MFKKRLILVLALVGVSVIGYFSLLFGLEVVHRPNSIAAAEDAFERLVDRTSRCETSMAEFARSFGEDTSEVNFLRTASRMADGTEFLFAEWLTGDTKDSLFPRYATQNHGTAWTIRPEKIGRAIGNAAASDWTQETNVFFSGRFRREGNDMIAAVCPVPNREDPTKTNGYAVGYFRVLADPNPHSDVSFSLYRCNKNQTKVVYPSRDDGVGPAVLTKTIDRGPEKYRFVCRERESFVAQRGRLALLGLLLGPFCICSILRMEWKQAAVKLESRNEGLLEENAEQRELQRTLKSLLQLREQERRLVSSDIHDGFIQEAISAQMFLEALATRVVNDPIAGKQLSNARRSIDQAVREGRQLVNRNLVLAVDEHGFLPALQRLVCQQEDFGVDVLLRFPPKLPELDIQLQRAAYRIIQESLCNVRRHSGASQATVSLTVDSLSLYVDVVDQGRGFDLDDVASSSFGMRGIRERAEVIGGEAHIKSEPGEGTIVQVSLPLHANTDDAAELGCTELGDQVVASDHPC